MPKATLFASVDISEIFNASSLHAVSQLHLLRFEYCGSISRGRIGKNCRDQIPAAGNAAILLHEVFLFHNINKLWNINKKPPCDGSTFCKSRRVRTILIRIAQILSLTFVFLINAYLKDSS
jgi:hypothetical protein